MKRRTFVKSMLTVPLYGLLAQGCASQTTRAKRGSMVTATATDMSTMDMAHNDSVYWAQLNIFDRLFETRMIDGQATVVNSLCTDYRRSEDGLTYDFTLREGVLFSNGDPLTSSDVCYSFSRLLTEAAANTEIPLQIKGGEALMKKRADKLEGFNIKDNTHFSIVLEAPNGGFIAELSSPAMSIVNERVTRTAKNFGKEPTETIGSGPYYAAEWVPNDHFTMRYNEHYWGEEPTVKEAVRRIIPDASTQDLMFQNGEMDIISLSEIDSLIVQRSYKTERASQIVHNQQIGMTFVALNETNRFLKDVRVRKAICMAIDVNDIVHNLMCDDGMRQNGIIPTGIWGHNDKLEGPPFDPDGARALLAEAGYHDGDVSFEFALSSNGPQLLYETVSNQLSKIGVKANIKVYDKAAFMEKRLAGEVESFIGTWFMDYNDPANIMAVFFGGPERSKGRSICYPNVDIMQRVSAAKHIVDDEKRKKEYQDLERKIVIEDRAWIPLYEGTRLFCTGDRVESFTPFWAGYEDFCVKDVVLKKEARA
ncbi:MAG: ABC transporter substrate-binding protein [Atopobiaceae bacterium]|nr:ABC transporter substrate-binding protein [Atopobiaceae bacterium]